MQYKNIRMNIKRVFSFILLFPYFFSTDASIKNCQQVHHSSGSIKMYYYTIRNKSMETSKEFFCRYISTKPQYAGGAAILQPRRTLLLLLRSNNVLFVKLFYYSIHQTERESAGIPPHFGIL